MKIVHAQMPDGTRGWGRLTVDGAALAIVDGTPFDGGAPFATRPTREVLALERVALLPPATPSKIMAIGRNYRAHAAELGNAVPESPLLFLKAPSSLLAPGGRLLLPPESERVDYEGELTIVFGREIRRLPRARWREAILGYTIACDVTARDLQKKDGQFARAKSFDGFCPLGPWIETDLDVATSGLTTRVNGEVRQSGRFSDLIFPPDELVAFVSAPMTILPGDVLLTGTPEGVAPLAAGDRVEIEVEEIGVLTFAVEKEEGR